MHKTRKGNKRHKKKEEILLFFLTDDMISICDLKEMRKLINNYRKVTRYKISEQNDQLQP